jgi:putative hydrolase of the HAD superfamily
MPMDDWSIIAYTVRMRDALSNGQQSIKAAIFDLDNCLAAANEIGPELFEPAFNAIRQANRGTLVQAELELALSECWRQPFDFVAETHGFSPEMLTVGWQAFSQVEVQTAMHGYGDLDALRRLPWSLFLVTSGFRKLQESKIRALGCASRFTGVFVDALGEPDRSGKQAHFSRILQDYKLSPGNTLVVGDNPDSEIVAGRNLGMPTVQILRPGVP